MEILNLATKEKQDEILSYFPINGGTDFNNMLPKLTLYKKEAPLDSYRTMASISGKGILVALSTGANPSLGAQQFKVTADGVVIFEDFHLALFSTISLFVPFNNSIKIEVRVATPQYPTSNAIFMCNYLLS